MPEGKFDKDLKNRDVVYSFIILPDLIIVNPFLVWLVEFCLNDFAIVLNEMEKFEFLGTRHCDSGIENE